MNAGYEAMPHDHWPVVHDLARRTYGITEAWPVELAGHHLRWLAGERILGRLKDKLFPTAATLGSDWNWPRWRAAEFIADVETWMDPFNPVTLEFLRGQRFIGINRTRKKAEQIPTVDRRQADGEPTAGTDERRESEAKADGGPTVDRRQADATRAVPLGTPHTRGEKEEIAPPPAAAPPAPAPTPGKPKKPPTPGYPEAVALWTKLYAEAFGRRYVWQFEGRDADGARVKTWLAAAEVTASDPAVGLVRLEGAIRAYVAAEAAGKVFPFEDLPDTRRFSKALPQWFGRAAGGVRPRAPPGPSGRPTNGHGKPSPLETFLSWSQTEDGHEPDDSARDGDPPGGEGWESTDLGHRTAGDRRRVVDVPG